MSAFSNFMNIFFPNVALRRRQQYLDQLQQNTLSALEPFVSRQETVQAPFEADTFGPEDPLAQLQAAGTSGNLTTSIRQTPGLFNQRQAEGISALLSNPQTQGFGSALLQSMIPQQTAKNQVVELPTGGMTENGTPLMQKFIVDINSGMKRPLGPPAPRGSGVTVNVGDTKPLGKDAANWKNTENQSPDPRLTVNDAARLGYSPRTTEELKDIKAVEGAVGAVGSLFKNAFGKNDQDSLFPSAEEGTFSRVFGGLGAKAASMTKSDERIVLYDSQKEAFLSSLARIKGQSGTLTDVDLQLVRDLFPTPGLTPLPTAKAQFQAMAKDIISKGISKQQLLAAGFPKWAFSEGVELPSGFTVER